MCNVNTWLLRFDNGDDPLRLVRRYNGTPYWTDNNEKSVYVEVLD